MIDNETNNEIENIDDENVVKEITDLKSEENQPPEEKVAEEITTENDSVEEISEQPEMSDEHSDIYKWYAVRIIAGHENKVKIFLETRIKENNLEHKIRTVMIPLEKVFEIKNGKKKIREKNFFPGYILIEADLDDNVKRFLAKVPSLMNLVGSKNIKGQKLEPVPLRDTEIRRIKAILNDENQTEKIDLRLSEGDPVKVTSGPFNNFNGSVLEINTEKMKVKVMVSIFGRKTPIDLDFTQIEKQK